MNKKHYLKPTGKTEDGKTVIAGTFNEFDSNGLPLPTMFSMLSVRNAVPDPIDFYNEAVKAGWTLKTIFTRLEEAYCDGYGKPFWVEVQKRLIFFIQRGEENNNKNTREVETNE